jgi:hypothetical protein
MQARYNFGPARLSRHLVTIMRSSSSSNLDPRRDSLSLEVYCAKSSLHTVFRVSLWASVIILGTHFA